ncbi:MAG TPA: flagellar protein FlaG [Casimicrobiaceae bacterium]
MVIRPLESASPSSATAAGGVAIAADGRDNGNAASPAQSTAPTREEVQAAVDAANASLDAMNHSIEFSIDPDTRSVVVRLIDKQDNQVLRQVPSQEMLAIAKAIDDLQDGLLLRNRA